METTITTIEELEQAFADVRMEFAKVRDQHKLSLFDDTTPRTGLIIKEPICDDTWGVMCADDEADEDDEDLDDADGDAGEYNMYLMGLITDEAERLGATASVEGLTTTISWPKMLMYDDVRYPLYLDTTRFVLPVEVGQFAIYASKVYQLMLVAIDMLKGDREEDMLTSY